MTQRFELMVHELKVELSKMKRWLTWSESVKKRLTQQLFKVRTELEVVRKERDRLVSEGRGLSM